MKYLIRNSRRKYEDKLMGVCRVFLDGRPLDDGDIVGDFAWRFSDLRSHYAEVAKDKNFRNVVRRWLVKNKYVRKEDKITFHFSRYTGCGMCPCSPGIIVRSEGLNGRDIPALWVEVHNDHVPCR